MENATEMRFEPHPLVRSATVQTLLARIRPSSSLWIQRCTYPVVLDGGPDHAYIKENGAVRLFGYYSPRWITGSGDGDGGAPGRGLVLLLHGWEGCSHSVYNLVLAARLCTAGYDVFRLNVRDHGPAHDLVPQHLNRGMFFATLIDEVEAAIQQVASSHADRPFYLVAPSMGGNFALRMAARQIQDRIPNLKHIVAISPSINPGRTIDQIDRQAMYREFFRNNWLRSLAVKQKRFPELYALEPLTRIPSLRGMTEWLVRRYSPYRDADDYFSQYAVAGSALAHIHVRTTVVTAIDDEVIPPGDFYGLARHPLLAVHMLAHGGHVGFVDVLPFRHCLPDIVLSILDGSDV